MNLITAAIKTEAMKRMVSNKSSSLDEVRLKKSMNG
jgi:hypothetical protein